ncbi:hypothetical protein HID58_020425 [Brassica napus]|uniref:Uncharacterized protein n=1 Tax=Brassica napus TaxID=3708 RepID=A0ABQ7XGW3_BRANA|nr:hypothetical protein HID58_020425 [Brassica napus]
MSMAVSHHAAAFTGLQDVNYCHRVMVLFQTIARKRRSWRELQSSDTDVGAVRDAMSMAVSHHAAAFTDGLQDVNYCHRVMVVGSNYCQKGFGKDPNFLTLTCVDSQVYSLDWTPEMNQIVSASQQDTLRCCSSMAALSLPSLPNVLISDTCGEAYGLCESKLQSLFNQISFHTSQARNLKQRRT